MIPNINYSPPISDLFANFFQNWETLTPILNVLFGILFGTFLLAKLKDLYF